MAIAYSMIERTIRARYVDDVLCVYNRGNPLSHDKDISGPRPLVSERQLRTSRLLGQRKSRIPPADDAFVCDHITYYLTALSVGLSNREALLRNATTQALAKAVDEALKSRGGGQNT